MGERSEKKQRRWLRRILIHGCIALTILIALCVVILFTPFQSDFLDRKIKTAFHQATGLRISFETAVYHLAGGNVSLSDIRVEVPDGQRVTRVSNMDFRWRWRLWGAWPPVEPFAVEIASSEPVILYLGEDGRITPGPALQSTLDFFKTIERPSGDLRKPRERIKPIRIAIRNQSVYLREKPESATGAVSAPTTATQRLAGLENLDIEMQYNGVDIWPLLVSGRLWGKRPASFAGSLSAPTGTRDYAFYVETNALDLKDHFRAPLPFSFTGKEIRVSGHVSAGEFPGKGAFDLSAQGKELQTSFSQRLKIPETDLLFSTAGSVDWTSRTLQLKNTDLRAFDSSFFGKGGLSLAGARPFSVEITSGSLSSKALNSFSTLAPAEMPRFVGPRGAVRIRGNASGRAAPGKGGLDRFEISAEAKDLLTSFPQAGAGPEPAELEFRTFAAFAATSNTLELRDTEIRAFGSSLGGSAEMSLGTTRSFSLEIANATLSPGSLNMLLAFAPEGTPRAAIAQGKLQLRGRFSGNRTGLDWAASEGEIHGADLLLESDIFGEAAPRFGPVAFDARLTTNAMELSRLSVQVLSNNLTLSSVRVARSASRSNGSRGIRGNWSLDADAEEIARLLPRKYADRALEWKPRGAIRGLGSIQGEWPSALFAETGRNGGVPSRSVLEALLDNVKLDGLFNLEEARFDHGIMPAPLEGISGKILVGNESLMFSDMKGGMMGSDFIFEGGVSGKPFFWSQPSLDIRLKGALDLSQAPKWITPEMRQNEMRARIVQMAPSGRMGMNLQLRGPLEEPEQLTLAGSLTPTGVSLSLDMTSPTLAVSDLGGALELDLPREIRISKLDWKIGSRTDGEPVAFGLGGAVSNTGCNLSWKTEGNLPDYKRLIPPAFKFFEVDGPVALNLNLKSKRQVPNAPPPPTLAGLIQNLRAQFEDAESPLDAALQIAKTFDWSIQGNLEAKDCEFTHIYMPARVTHIVGQLVFDGLEIRTRGPLRAMWGSTEALTEGSITWDPGGYPRIEYTLSSPMLVVDEWVQQWGPKKKREIEDEVEPEVPVFDPSQKYDVPTNFVIEGRLNGRRASFQQFDLENVFAHFEFLDYTEKRAYVNFDTVKADLYGGGFNMNAWLFVQGPALKWESDFSLESVICETFLEAHTGKKPTVNGLLTMQLGLQGNTVDDSFLGKGTLQLRNSRFMGNPIFSALGQILRSRELEDISFTTMESEFSLDGKDLTTPKISLEGPIIKLDGEGTATLDGDLDLAITYRYLKLTGRIPILRDIAGVVEDVTSWLVRLHLGGTVNQPVVRIVPFSTDRINLNPFRSNEKSKNGNGENEKK